MHFSSVLAASLVAPLVAAHGGVPGAPKVYGLPNHLRARNPLASHKAPRNAMPMPHRPLIGRQNGDAGGVCGPDNGGRVCLSTECCSPEGNCGNGPDYCSAPDCLFDYGPACDANQTPAGASTRNDARPVLGSVAIGGAGIYNCQTPGQVALTFDDGPYTYTSQVLDLLDAAGAKATFFITGNNLGKGAIDTTWGSVISRMDTDGHQVASHTWSHQDLSNITESQMYDQMVKNEMALRNILGKYPTYMRPPYSDCTGTCQGVMSTLGYHVIYFNVDTDDYDLDSPELAQTAKNNFKAGIDASGPQKLVIAHDIHYETAYNLTSYMLSYLQTQNLTPVTVGQCLGDSATNWYRKSTPAVSSSSSSSTLPTSTPSSASSSAPVASPTGPTSTDGTCGGTNKYSCLGFKQENGDSGECCSQYGFCGSSALYCGTGCQAGFGKCGVVSASSTSSAPVATATAPTTDGSCGGVKGFTCAGYMKNGALNECCSDFGYCGNGTTYCGTGCQAGYGKCLVVSSSMSSMSSTVSVSSFSSMSSKAASSTSSAASVTSGSTRASSSTVSRSSSASSSSVGSSSSSKSTSMTRSSSSASVKSTASGSSSIRASASGSSSTRASVSGSSSTRASVSGASSTPVSASSGSASAKSTSAASSSAASVKATSAASSSAASVKPTSAAPYSASSFSTAVKPSSVSAYAASSPSASAVVSKNGKCGTKYGAGQTCAGYVNAMGVSVECCCADSGTCSNDSWSCGQGCDKGFGKCWGY